MKAGNFLAPVACVAALTGCSSSTGPSESYLWGEKAGNSAVSLTKAGAGLSAACATMLLEGAKWADDPVLNQSPPPKDLDQADAQKGCLDQLHKRLGY